MPYRDNFSLSNFSGKRFFTVVIAAAIMLVAGVCAIFSNHCYAGWALIALSSITTLVFSNPRFLEKR
jgi:hypothetical protein